MKSYGVTIQMKTLWLNSGMNRGYYMYIQPRREMKFLFECWKIFREWAQQASWIFFNIREISYL